MSGYFLLGYVSEDFLKGVCQEIFLMGVSGDFLLGCVSEDFLKGVCQEIFLKRVCQEI